MQRNKGILCVLALAVGALAGCQQESLVERHKYGTYTAARHMHVGSNIPQADDASSLSNVAGVDESAAERQSAIRQPTLPGGGMGGAR